MGNIIIGDYIYTYNTQTGTANVTVLEGSKTSYSSIESSITVDGYTYPVTSMNSCFEDCTSLTEAPEIPDSVTDMAYCFYGCINLIEAPVIPSGVINMYKCFAFCNNLTNNIIVYAEPEDYDDIFLFTQKPIYIIDRTASSSPSIWQDIAGEYENVHYGANDVRPPTIETTSYRTNDKTDNKSALGNYLYIKGSVTFSPENLPAGWTIEGLDPILTIDGVETQTTWLKSLNNNKYTYQAWISNEFVDDVTVTLRGQIQIKNELGEVDRLLQSETFTAIIRANTNIVFDMLPNGKGMGIGGIAQGDGFWCNWEMYLGLDTSAQSGTDKEIYDALVGLGWDDVIV